MSISGNLGQHVVRAKDQQLLVFGLNLGTGVLGVNRLRTKYGSKKNRGYKPEKFKRAGGKIIRTILQQSDKAGLTESIKLPKMTKGRSGRKLTEKGKSFMEEMK